MSDADSERGDPAVVSAQGAFEALVLARIIKPSSKLAAVGVLEEIGVLPRADRFGARVRREVVPPARWVKRRDLALSVEGLGGASRRAR
jgi:hypothetical protein